MASDPFAVLRKAGSRKALRRGLLGAGSFVLGLLLLSLRAAGLAGPVVPQVLAFVFVGLGVLLLGAAIFSGTGQLADLDERLRDRPATIVLAWRQVATRRVVAQGRAERRLGQHMAVVQADDGSSWTIHGTPDQVTAILSLVQACNPKAEVRGRDLPAGPASRGRLSRPGPGPAGRG